MKRNKKDRTAETPVRVTEEQLQQFHPHQVEECDFGTALTDVTVTGDKITKTRYVVGFLISKDYHTVALIEKQRPAWQQGKWNGIGGSVEQESPHAAMVREMTEEAGVLIREWEEFATLVFPQDDIIFFRAIVSSAPPLIRKTDERVKWWPISNLPPNLLPNLQWLIPLALYGTKEQGLPLTITAHNDNN